jgi:phosphatidylserine decarboxylase
MRKERTLLLQRLFETRLPRGVSRALGYAADLPLPRRALEPLIAAYSAAVGVDASDIDAPQGGFTCFGDFFARRLKPGARPVPEGDDVFVSPCDGTLAAVFEANGAGTALRIKGNDYSLDELLGASGEGERFAGGGGLVVYLHPRDYHRVHAPCRGDLVRARHVPGARYPVAPWSEKRVASLYQKNERVVFFVDCRNRDHKNGRVTAGPAAGAMALVMVAAMGVGDIASPHAPVPSPSERTTRALEPRLPLVTGDELGAFRLGSTVVLLWSEGVVSVRPDLAIGRKVVQGQQLGKIEARGT